MICIYRHNDKVCKGEPPEGAEVLYIRVGNRILSSEKFAEIRRKKHDKFINGGK